MTDELKNDLKNTREDYLHIAVKAGLSSVTVIGSALGEFFSMIVTQPVSRRRSDYLRYII